MRRMLLPEVKIKSKLKDDIAYITIEELLNHANINDSDSKTIIIQPLSQLAGDKNDGEGIYFSDSDAIYTDITNATLTITRYIGEDNNYIYINGLTINIVIDLSVTNIEDLSINSLYDFDVYIINP